MSSYKGHSIFALILSLICFHDPILIALSLIGANVPDFDHKFKKDNVYKIIIIGLIVFISLYIINLPYYIGLILVFLGIIFYFSEHRSFTHSIFGILVLMVSLFLILIWTYEVVVNFTLVNNRYFVMVILIALLSFLFLNKKLLLIFLPLFFISFFIFPRNSFEYYELVFALFLGLFSHIILDSFTPSGIKIFAPISSKKVHKKFGVIFLFIFVIMAILINFSFLFSLFNIYSV